MKTEKQKKKNREYMKEYRKRPSVRAREKSYNKKYLGYYNKRPEVIEKFKRYMKAYLKNPDERIKQKVRLKSQRIYGKVPKGYERHHINYDSPHNFILISIKVHKRIHEELRK